MRGAYPWTVTHAHLHCTTYKPQDNVTTCLSNQSDGAVKGLSVGLVVLPMASGYLLASTIALTVSASSVTTHTGEEQHSRIRKGELAI